MARSFNGSGEQIAIGNKSGLKPAGAFTHAFWCRPANFINSYSVVMADYNGSGGGSFVKTDSTMAFYFLPGAIDPSGITLTADIWAHIAITFTSQSAGTATPYFNGSPTTTFGVGGPISWPGDFRIGNNSANTPFNGRIADAAVWNVCLTTDEVLALAKGIRPTRVRPASLVGYWPIDGLESPEPDLSGNAYNGTLTGTVLAAGPPTTLFTPKPPIFSPLAAQVSPAQIYAFDQMAARFSRNITTIGY